MWSKIALIASAIGMAIPTIALGFKMLPGNLGIVWAGFNAWIWIGAPTIILYYLKKEKENENKKKF